MGDVEDPDVQRSGATDGGEQLAPFEVRQRGGRFVEDQQPSIDGQGAGEQSHRPLDRAECRGIAADIDLHAEAIEDSGDATAQRCPSDEPESLGCPVSEHHVLGDGEPGDDCQLLMLRGDAMALRVVGVAERTDRAPDRQRPGVRPEGTGDDPDQRRLAGAVLAEQGVHLARSDADADVAQDM